TEGMSPADRAALDRARTVMIVHDATTAASLAAATRGFVYDEVLHRIETARAFAEHGVWDVWRADRIAIVSDPQSGGTARLVTLGMRRFGAPDVEIEGAPGALASSLAPVMSRIAAVLAG